jgi:hypothetical protein
MTKPAEIRDSFVMRSRKPVLYSLAKKQGGCSCLEARILRELIRRSDQREKERREKQA